MARGVLHIAYMLKYFDYVFYRIYSFYLTKKEPNPLIMTLNFIGVIQLVILFAIALLMQKFTSFSLSFINKQYYWAFVTIIAISLYSASMLRYLRKKYYLQLIKENENSYLNDKIKTWMIFVQPIILIFLTIAVMLIAKRN